MNAAVQQYLELLDDGDVRALLTSQSSDVLNAPRAEALEALRRKGLPTRKDERYRYTDVQEAFEPHYGLNLRRLQFTFDPYKAYRCSVPNMGTALFYMVNDAFHTSPLTPADMPSEVYVGSLHAYATAHPAWVARYYACLAQPVEEDGIVALNTALAQDGLLVYVPDGVKVKQTLQVVNLLRGEMDLMTHRRTLVVIGDEAEATLLFCEHAMDEGLFLTTNVCETYMGRGSCLRWYTVEETTPQTRLFEHAYVSQGRESRLEYAAVTLRNGTTCRHLNVRFDGEGGEARVMGAVVAGGQQHVDNHLLIDHATGRCHSDINYKYVLDDTAIGAFAGKVLVRKDAQHTESEERNANLCVSPTARMYAQPMLEIYADDVKCNHGSTVGQIDQGALFYMAQRGIAADEARLLMQHAFVNEVIQQIELVPLRERLSGMVEQRFRHGERGCGDCALCTPATI